MADVNRGNRPLSPHLSIHRPIPSMVFSILHRITGVGMIAAAVLIVWWFVAGAHSPAAFERADAVLTSWLGTLVLVGSLWALSYHTLSGIRHLIWDTGRGYDLVWINRSGWAVAGGSLLLTAILLLIVR